MNDLIKITTNNQGQQVVSARELYLGLGLNKTQWSRWYQANIKNNDFFSENHDWIGVRHNVEGNEVQDFAISLEFAKHIAMMARTHKSHEYRNYFIGCEERLKESTLNTSQLSPELQMFKQIFDSVAKQQLEQQQIKAEIQETKEEIQGIRDIIEINPTAAWRKEVNRVLNAIGKKINNYNLPKQESYNALKDRAKCRPNVLIENLKKRAARNGMAPSKVAQLNMLDVLENDPRLREIYVAIVKDMAIKNEVRI